MARLLGFIANRPDLGARAVRAESHALVVTRRMLSEDGAPEGTPSDGEPASGPLGWGLGFYQGGEVLLKRRPIDDRTSVRLADLVAESKTDLLIAHVRSATVGTTSTENTHPFRYRQWLFACTGTVSAFGTLRHRLTESLPQFLQRDVRGDTDSELLFHLFLSFLHDAGQLEQAVPAPQHAHSAARSTLALIDRLCAEEGGAPSRLNLLLSTPEHLMAVHAGKAMAYRTFAGRGEIPPLFDEDEIGRAHTADFDSCRVTLVASDFEHDRAPVGWTEIAPRSIVTFHRTDALVVTSL